ncbi:MAG: sirohydrochlorin chelatase [Cyanomargarita calcarea GSE-NOS-MK-12-04C]|jgi:sirohydrochlorin ferrochelatase|uniref:Sirohydrochlorin chelatase n=1 Tax=Cyanomargarita calcarea GSE-NOS-MK-12-04C TaxID=2839659 RepID=A0A951QSA2_9CYAN|nr:sirohydrochlorin chelatase [Cyanomargarita calcarea GSE-NOS-MK-12-04C]
MPSSGYLLVSHGSRDPRPSIAMQQLAGLVQKKFQDKGMASPVGTAYLELSSEPLHEQIKQFALHAKASNCTDIRILPIFLLSGVHVMEDIPAEVALSQQTVGQDMMISLQPYLGRHTGLWRLLVEQMVFRDVEAWIILSHGSRRLGALEPVEVLAKRLEAVTAYWSVPPSLEWRVEELVTAGYKKIGILTYFLFAGGITDAIARKQEELKLQFPGVSFHLAEPLGATPELAEVIWDLMQA